jgi:hypothetical protein
MLRLSDRDRVAYRFTATQPVGSTFTSAKATRGLFLVEAKTALDASGDFTADQGRELLPEWEAGAAGSIPTPRAAGAPATMSTPVTLLFDLDGTLTDNYCGISRSILHALDKLGATGVGEDELRTCVGPPLRRSFARLLHTDDPVVVERALALYRERYAVEGWRENEVYAGSMPRSPRCTAWAPIDAGTWKPKIYAERIVTHFAAGSMRCTAPNSGLLRRQGRAHGSAAFHRATHPGAAS